MPFDDEFAIDIEEEFGMIAPQMREFRPLGSDERPDGEVPRQVAPRRPYNPSPDQHQVPYDYQWMMK